MYLGEDSVEHILLGHEGHHFQNVHTEVFAVELVSELDVAGDYGEGVEQKGHYGVRENC